MKWLFALLLLMGCGVYATVRYDNYTVYRVVPKTQHQLNLLHKYEESSTFDFWKGASRTNEYVDIMVSPQQVYDFEILSRELRLKKRVMIQNVQDLIDQEQKPKSSLDQFNWKAYHSLNTINAWLDSLETTYPGTVTVVIGGQSHENRHIRGVYVNFNPNNKAVFLEGGIHAREWIAPATVTFILNELLTNTDPEVRQVIESRNWYVFPSVNPDGYEYSRTNNRMWRKTKKPYGDCIGADANRNWGYHWNEGGTSSNPCTDTYPGDKEFSEKETRTLSGYINQIVEQLDTYLSFHCYSQVLLIPFGHWGSEVPENNEQLHRIGLATANKLAERYGTQYTVGNIPEVMYYASGGSHDWVAGIHKVKLVYTYELRDTGEHGFLLPPEQIIPTGLETFDSIVEMIRTYDAEQKNH